MKRLTILGTLFLLLPWPKALQAQDLALGVRVGTLGLGAEAALGVSDRLVFRGGLGSFILELDGDYDGIGYTVTPPSLTGTLGVDLYPTGGSFRLMAGMMFREGDFELESEDLADADGVEIGNQEYDQDGTLSGALATSSAAPFLGLGFGRHTAAGFGVFMDFGVAFVGDPEVSLQADGAIASAPNIQENLDLEARNLEEDAGDYLKFWPILSLGVKIPLG